MGPRRTLSESLDTVNTFTESYIKENIALKMWITPNYSQSNS